VVIILIVSPADPYDCEEAGTAAKLKKLNSNNPLKREVMCFMILKLNMISVWIIELRKQIQ
jgi:hypothetical protein